MFRRLIVVSGQEEKTFSSESTKVYGIAIREVACSSCIVQVETFTKFLLKPLTSCFDSPTLFDFVEYLVKSKQLICALSLLCNKATDVSSVSISVWVNTYISKSIVRNKVV